MNSVPFFQQQHIMGAIRGTDSAMDADGWLVGFVVPEDRAQHAGSTALSAADAFGRVQTHSAAGAQEQCINRTYPRAGRILACPANHYRKTALHPSRRADTYASHGQSRLVASGASEHAALAAHTAIGIDHRKSNNLGQNETPDMPLPTDSTSRWSCPPG